jgi:NAD(P)-dependent dehydrogenase (short-subunit alcohol dehydrogenase family)
MNLSLPGAVVVTGASGGLGFQLVSDLLSLGLKNVACHYRSTPRGLPELLKSQGLVPDDHLFQAELVHEAEVAQLQIWAKERYGRVWGLVNLAGASSNEMSWKLTTDEFRRIVDANLTTTFLMTREFLPHMRENGGGRIINTSSVVAHTGIVGAAHYCASKAAIEGLTKAIAQEVASKKITVNSIALGYFDQGLIKDVPQAMLNGLMQKIPMRRLGKATEFAALVFYLLSEQAEFLTGQVLHLNGGQYA